MTPTKEGYYWYRDFLLIDEDENPIFEWDDVYEIVKVQLYSKHPKKGSKLMFQKHGKQYLTSVKKAKGVWGKKICKLKKPKID